MRLTEPGSAQPRCDVAPALMILGTCSNVGKSLLVVALCRWLSNRGVDVAPFKAANVALNAYATPDDAEIGWAQAQQAWASRITPVAHLNPVLMKPAGSGRLQTIIQGQVASELDSLDADTRLDRLRGAILDSASWLQKRHEVVIVEGSGSPVELNLRHRDLANLWLGNHLSCPFLLAADASRGGVFASLLGTLDLMTAQERSRLAGVVVNRLHGEPALFADGVEILERRGAGPCLGVIPHLDDLGLGAEDSLDLEGLTRPGQQSAGSTSQPAGLRRLRIAVARTPHMAMTTDLTALAREPSVELELIDRASRLVEPPGFDLLILPGSKDTIADLGWLLSGAWSQAIREHHRAGGWALGLCGGLQALGETVEDPHGVESGAGASSKGLGMLPIRSVMAREKTTRQVRGRLVDQSVFEGELRGFEIHLGETTRLSDRCQPLLELLPCRPGADSSAQPVADGARLVPEERVWGTYVHGLLDTDGFRLGFLDMVRSEKGLSRLGSVRPFSEGGVDAEIERWTAHVARHVDLEAVAAVLGIR